MVARPRHVRPLKALTCRVPLGRGRSLASRSPQWSPGRCAHPGTARSCRHAPWPRRWVGRSRPCHGPGRRSARSRTARRLQAVETASYFPLSSRRCRTPAIPRRVHPTTSYPRARRHCSPHGRKTSAAGSRQGTAAPAQRARGRGATVPARPGGRWERKTFVGLLARHRRWRPSHGRGGSLPRPCRTECSAPGVPRSVSP